MKARTHIVECLFQKCPTGKALAIAVERPKLLGLERGSENRYAAAELSNQ
jgi:hypothetical protein